MSNQENKNTKSEKKLERKKIIKFIVLMVLFGIVGFGFGMGTARMENMLRSESFISGVISVLSTIVPIVYIVINVIVFTVSMLIWRKAKKELDNLNGDEEELLDRIEKRLNRAVIAYNIVTVSNCLFFGALIEISGVPKRAGVNLPYFIFSSVSFVLFFILEIVVAILVMDLIKRINPERNAVSIFDMNYQKQWENSSDEAQKLILYKAAYETYKVTNIVCAVMWLVTLFAQLIYKTGVFPLICICVIWVTLIGVNSITQAKLEGGGTL